MRRKIFTLTAAVLFTVAVITGCKTTGEGAGEKASQKTEVAESDKDVLSRIKKAGVITVGTEGTYSPYSYYDKSGELVGYDVEVVQKIAEKLGVKAEFVETKWDSMIAGLDAKRFDIIANQVGITEERKEKYDFTEAYTYIYGALITSASNEDIKDFADLKGKKSAQTLTSNWGQDAEGYGAELVGVDGFDQSIELILSGRADATINADAVYYDYLKQKPGADLKIVKRTKDASLSAIPVRKGEDILLDAINKAVLELKESGELSKLSEKYFGADLSKEQ